jgi:hypothetical protein
MPARKRTNLNPDAPPEAQAPRTAVADPDALSDDAERILAELGEGASSVAIWRESDSRPGVFDFLARVPAGEFTNEWVSSQYGGGYYKIIISDAQQGPLNPVFLSVDRRLLGKAFSVTGTAPVSGHDGAFKDRLLEILLARALTPPPAPPVPQHNSAQETLAIIAALAPLLKGNDNNGNAMEMVATLLSSATDLASHMHPQEGLSAVAGQLLPVVDRLVAAATSRQAPRLPAPRPIVQNPPAPAATSATTVDTSAAEVETPKVAGTIVPRWLAPFQQFAGVLVSLADTEADPALYAEVCVDQLSANEEAFRSAVVAMEAGTLKDDVLNAVPALKETEIRVKFVTELVTKVEEGLREVIKEQTEDAASG